MLLPDAVLVLHFCQGNVLYRLRRFQLIQVVEVRFCQNITFPRELEGNCIIAWSRVSGMRKNVIVVVPKHVASCY